MSTVLSNSELTRLFAQAIEHLDDPKQLGYAIAGSLKTVTEDNFDAEGRPKWAGLHPDYKKRRKGGKILFVSGALRDSVVTDVTESEVTIGSNLPYSRLHQWGGVPGMRRNATMPARPYLPFDQAGNLQLEAEDAVTEDALSFMNAAF